MSTAASISDGRKSRSLFSRFKLNLLAYGYSQLITIISQLMLVPFFLKYWGTARYSEWLVLTGVPAMLTLLDFGVAQASANKASIFAGANNKKRMYCSLDTAFVFTLAVCFAVVLISLIGVNFLNWVNILKLTELSEGEASNVLMMMALYLCVNLLGGPIDAWFRAIDHTVAGALLLANRRLVDVIVSVAVLIFGGSASNLAAGLFWGQCFSLIVLVVALKKFSEVPVLGVSSASFFEFKEIWRSALAYASFPFAQMVTLQGGVQMLNQVSSPSVVVAFTMARTLMRLIIQVGVVCNSALKPEISRLAGVGDFNKVKIFTLKASVYISLLCIFLYACAIFMGPTIVRAWSNNSVFISSSDLVFIGIHAVFNIFWFIPSALLIAINKHATIAVVYGCSSVTALVIWIFMGGVIPPVLGASLLLLIPEIFATVVCFLNIRKTKENLKFY